MRLREERSQDTIVQKVFYARDSHEKQDLLIGVFLFFFAYIGKKSTQRSFLFVYYTDDFDTCDLIVVLIATQMIINRV